MERCAGIGVFDSGVGGLTVASRIAKLLPNEKIYYFGDTAHVPYGDKTESQIKSYVHNIIDYLKSQKVKALVMACNTSSAVVLPYLKDMGIPVLGVIEHASRMAIKTSVGERIGVVANPVTVRSRAYVSSLKGISKNGVQIYQKPCPRWVPLIEAGKISGREVEKVVREDLDTLIEAQIDTLILGCTHYPYFTQVIKKILPDNVKIINPADAMVLQLKKELKRIDMLSNSKHPEHRFYVSGNPKEFRLKGSWFFGQWINRIHKVDLDNPRNNEVFMADIAETLLPLAVA